LLRKSLTQTIARSAETAKRTVKMAMTNHLDKYRPYLKGHALSSEAEKAVLETLWQAVETLVYQALTGIYPQVSAQDPTAIETDTQADAVNLQNTFNRKETS